MKCVVFGGGGFIGSTICDRLLESGYKLRIFERPRIEPYRTFNINEPVEWVTGDFSSAFDVSEAIKGMDTVIHLVSTTLPKNSNDDPVYDVQSNIIPSLQILNSMVAWHVKKIIFISSGGTIYGDPEYIPIDEKHPTNPRVSYGVTKLMIEKYLNIFEKTYGINSITLRVSNPYGERQRIETAQGAISTFIQKVVRGEPIEIWGDGTVTRDYLHVSDVAEAFIQAVQYTGTKNVFNISSGTGTSLNEIIMVLQKLIDIPIRPKYLPSRSFDVPVNILSNTLAKQELKWEPRISLINGIKRTLKWVEKEQSNTLD